MITRLLSFVFLACFLMVNSAHAAVATYTLSGGKIDGTLNGVSFSGADFTITADADPDRLSSSFNLQELIQNETGDHWVARFFVGSNGRENRFEAGRIIPM